MKKLPAAPEYGIETSKLDIDESELLTKPKPKPVEVKEFVPVNVKTEVLKPKVEKKDTTF